MTLNHRLDRLEAVTRPNGCATCEPWGWRVVNDRAGDSPYELEHRRSEPPGPLDWPAACPDCEREIPTISIIYIDGAAWRDRSAL